MTDAPTEAMRSLPGVIAVIRNPVPAEPLGLAELLEVVDARAPNARAPRAPTAPPLDAENDELTDPGA